MSRSRRGVPEHMLAHCCPRRCSPRRTPLSPTGIKVSARSLRWDRECAVRFYSDVIERLIEAQMVVIAKAQCEDGRTFDAIQRDAPEDFEITECTPTEQACSGECVSRKH